MSQHIYFTGYRGTGKTSVARIVAETLGRPLIDLDQRIEQKAGKSIEMIFIDGGETAFREIESEVLLETDASPSAVISLGGGAILRPENRSWIQEHGICIWLDADAETVAARLAGDQTTPTKRPSLTDLDPQEEIVRLMTQRRPLYQQVANLRIDTSTKTLQQVADEVVQFASKGDFSGPS